MKLLLVTAATAAIALAAPYNPYSPYNLSPIPSYYYSPYNAISGGVPSAVYGTYSNLYSPYNTVSYSNQVPTATNAQLKTGNPCAVSGKAYMDAIIEGKSIDDAGFLSGRAFIVAFGDLARTGKSIEDPACADAAKAFIESANPPDSASAESAKAFIDATLSTSASGYDPVCAKSALAYMDAFASGKGALTSNLIAAKAFFEEYAKGSSPGPDSPCVKATTASKANKDAMLAFINQAVND